MANKRVLLLLPTFSQTIEQRVCIGVSEVFASENVSVLHVPLGYLPFPDQSIEPHLEVHRQLRTLEPDLVIAHGGGLSYLSGVGHLKSILKIYEGIPVISMAVVLEGYVSVDIDNYKGMYKLMRNLIQRKPGASFAYVSGPEANLDNQLRYQALADALREQGRDISEVAYIQGDFTASVAQDAFQDYLNGAKEVADIIVCANDLNAKGVFDCLANNHIRCPEDVWVSGFDDFEYAASMQPGLSTVHFPARDLGRTAASLALKLMANETVPEVTIVSGFPVLRGSTEDEHPGYGDHEKQLREQWAMVQERDNNARKLAVMRGTSHRDPIQQVLKNTRHAFADLNVSELSLFVKDVRDDGRTYFKEYSLQQTTEHDHSEQLILPTSFSEKHAHDYQLFINMALEDAYFGYLTARCSPIAAEFVEYLTPQYTDLLNTEALEARNENYRLQTELNERMASLGSLVSGVAHEVNTPIGTGKLAASSMLESIQRIKRKVSDGALTKSDFDEFIGESEEISEIIYQSLDRAAELITNFKMVSVDQTAEAQRKFDLGEYIQSVLISLRHQLKGTSIMLKSDLEEGIEVETFPGAVAQVVTNLFMNSKKHGFDNATLAGTISLSLKKAPSGFKFIIEDDGQGATKEVMNHVFDPFFTTSRGKGGSGLGMHIVYNIVTQKLHWTIRLESEPGNGFRAIMQPSGQGLP